MRTVSAVIGASFGDEGKGHIVDYLARPTSLVIRFNGGAQAGHTVVRMNRSRHVFHHFGSGTLAGAATFLSRFFIANPMIFVEEFRELKRRPTVYVDPRCIVSTPYDMMLNQSIETTRAGERHGSCGVGIHETKKRSETDYRIEYGELERSSRSDRRERLDDIRRHWVPRRAKEMGLDEDSLPLLLNEGLLEHFLDDIETMTHVAFSMSWDKSSLPYNANLVFEGAQGLRLDEDAQGFPYVTHSKTGLPNVLTLMEEAGLSSEKLEVYYVTRPYITRHGAGPLSHERLQLPQINVKDPTNQENRWQGQFRLGLFDLEEFLPPVVEDLRLAERWRVAPHLALTCLDQVERQRIPLADRIIHPDDLLDAIASACNMESCLKCFGPMRNDVTLHRIVWRREK